METAKTPGRILALDIMRGITIAGMILVNNPGSWSYMYAPLEHAPWTGLTPTDLVFPFFMFIMGITTFISLRKYNFSASAAAIRKILVRTLVIFLVGSLIGMFAHFCYYWNHADTEASFGAQLLEALNVFPTMRLTGVLHRLAVCYCIVAILALTVSHKRFPWIIGIIFAVYFVVLELFNGYAYDETNVLAIVDRALLTPAYMYNDNGIDPEGLLSTLPSVAHVMTGFMAGRLMLPQKSEAGAARPLADAVLKLFILGSTLLVAGFLLSYACPISKKIWTPTFAMVTCGFASLVLALLVYAVDMKGFRRWGNFFASFGANPLFLFIMSDVFAILLGSIRVSGTTLHSALYNALVPLFGETGGSCVFAVLFVLFNFAVVAYPLYKRKIFIKI
jgi:predicted acyltransferase